MSNIPKKISLVLSGGSEKGCFQVGAFKAITEAGFAPDRIYGTSLGSLNGAFIAHAAAELQLKKGEELTVDDWRTIARQLSDYWRIHICQPRDLTDPHARFVNAWHVLLDHFNVFTERERTNEKIDEILTGHLQMMAEGPVKLKVASVDFVSSDIFYVSPGDRLFLTFIKGSIAMPALMAPTELPEHHGHLRQMLFDGGVRAVVPLGRAINDGAKDIIAIVCQSEQINPRKAFDEYKMPDVIERIMDIVVNQNINNDVKVIDILNGIIKEAKLRDPSREMESLQNYQIINHTVIRPETPLLTHITSFTDDDIKRGIQFGYETAENALRSKTLIIKHGGEK